MTPKLRQLRAVAPLLIWLVGACKPIIYDIDRMSDPVEKARFSCQYVLERALAAQAQKDADGVLRRRIADFAEPQVTRQESTVTVNWPAAAISLRADASKHQGGCVMTLIPNGRRVDEIRLDGRALNAGFIM